MSARRRISAAVILVFVMLPGCVPGVAWFPDGKKIAFSDFSDAGATGSAFVTYDLAGKTRTVVVKDTKTKTLWPAVSPDGKRLAAARWEHTMEGKPSELQVILFKMDGTEAKRSRIFPWEISPAGRAGSLDETYLQWSCATHILIMANKAAIYDIEKDQITEVSCTPWLWGSSPVRPDGKGFLATTDPKGTDPELIFLTWKGDITRLGTKVPMEKALGSVGYLHWDGNTAVLAGATATMRIDTEKKKVVTEPTRGNLPLKAPGDLVSWHRFPDTGLSLCCFNQQDPNDTSNRSVERIEIHDSVKKTRKVLAGPFSNVGPFIPSPDRTRVAIRPRGTGPGGAIIVFDSAGKILADLHEKQP